MKIPFTETHIITTEDLRNTYKLGRASVLIELGIIVKNAKYPEDLEMDICDYLEREGNINDSK